METEKIGLKAEDVARLRGKNCGKNVVNQANSVKRTKPDKNRLTIATY